MLRNQVDVNEVVNRQRFPKNNYFCYRWRILDNFNRSIDRQMFHLSVQGADNHRGLLADKILQLYKARYHGSRQDLIVDLAQDAMKFLDRRREKHHNLSKQEVMLSKATRELMDRTFNTLLAFSTELNSLLGLSELFIAASEPEVKKRSSNHETSIAISVQSHLSTSLFRLVIEGTQDKISFYMIPADNILALSEMAERYNPIEIWNARFDDQHRVFWVSNDGILTEEMHEVSCAELLRVLLGTTQEGLSPSDYRELEKSKSYDLLEVDPWQRDSSSSSTTADFAQASGHTLATPDRRFDYAPFDAGWKGLDDVPQHSFPQQPKPQPAANLPQTNAFSISISTGYESAPAPMPASNHTMSSEGTRTDSVPSLATLMRESGQFPALEAPAAVATHTEVSPVEDITVQQDALFFTDEPQEPAKTGFDLKTEYFADRPDKKSANKGVSNKRSTKKTNSKKGGKKKR